MSLVDPNTFYTVLKSTISSLRDASDNDLFDDVALYDAVDIEQAMADLALRRDQTCFIVPQGHNYEPEVVGNGIRVHANLNFALLITDKNPRSGQAGVFGDANTLGTIALAHRCVTQLSGAVLAGTAEQTAALSNTTLLPGDGDTLLVVNSRNKPVKTRKAWLQLFSADGGTQRVVHGGRLRALNS